MKLKDHNIDQSSCLVDELLKINSNTSNENEELKKKLRELEFGSLPITLVEENQSLKENLNLLQKRLKDAKTFIRLEKINRM